LIDLLSKKNKTLLSYSLNKKQKPKKPNFQKTKKKKKR
jgi:hypothetical protein